MQTPPKIPHPPIHPPLYPPHHHHHHHHHHCYFHGPIRHPLPLPHFPPPFFLFFHHHHHHHHQQQQQQQQEAVIPPLSSLPVELSSGDQQVTGFSVVGLEKEDLRENLEQEEEEGDDVFVMTDEWKEFFAKSEAKRRLKKLQSKKGRR